MANPTDKFLPPISLVILFAFLFASSSTSYDGPTGRRLLVVLDDLAIRSTHSIFFGLLKSRGYDLDFKLADDSTLSLKLHGQFLYDGLILFSPSAKRFGGSLNLEGIVEFVDSGHDLVLAADSMTSDLIRDVATECGVDFDDVPAAVVMDHTGYAILNAEGDHTLIASDDFIKSEVILGEKKIEAPVLFRGIGHAVNAANNLVLHVLSASPSAYSANPEAKLSKPPVLAGSSISLVSVVQARNNARIVISGSLDLFSDRFLKSSVKKAGSTNTYELSGNKQFVNEISKWVFHDRGHLKAVNVKHHKVGKMEEPAMYRIKDDVEYSVEIYEWSGANWKPYITDDVQLQFYMMSPYVLKTLSTDEKGIHSTSFKVPDVYGVFQFKVEYQRLGYTSLSLSTQIPVRPFRHNEYERFLTAAYPYYGGAFSTMAGFFIFSIVYLYSK